MSQFQGVKCDECGRIQGESNHWEKAEVHLVDGKVILMAFGQIDSTIVLGRTINSASSMIANETRDLCGQACAMKHIAKLLGWNVTSED